MKLSLSRLLIIIGAVFCVLLLTAMLFLSNTFGRINRETDLQLRTDIVKSAAVRIEQSVTNVEQTLRSFAARSTLLEFMTDSALEQFNKMEILRNSMNDLTLYVPLIKNVHLLMDNGQTMRSVYNDGDFLSEYLQSEALIEPIRKSQPFYRTRLTDISYVDGVPSMAVAVPILSNRGLYYGAIVAVCDLRDLTGMLPDQMEALLMNDGQMLLGNRSAWEGAADPVCNSVQLDGVTCAVIRQALPTLGWQLVSAYPVEQWHDIAVTPRQIVLTATLMVIVIVILLLVVHRMIVEPIESITLQMEEMPATHQPIVNRHRERNELTRLANGINEMTGRISLLNEDILRVNQEKYQLQLDQLSDRVLLLQTQVNPHFLYNNLECIRGMAYLGNMEGVREMAVCMAHVARYCVKGGLSTVQQELDCVRSYFRIICLRYGDAYTMQVHADDAVLDQPCPRMLLQPIVENAVFHGFVHAKRRSGSVKIHAQLLPDGRVRLCAENDGVGLEPAVLERMNQEFRASRPGAQQKLQERIGLYNVNYRLCLLTETEGILLENMPEGGLRVIIEFRMPRAKEEMEPCSK